MHHDPLNWLKSFVFVVITEYACVFFVPFLLSPVIEILSTIQFIWYFIQLIKGIYEFRKLKVGVCFCYIFPNARRAFNFCNDNSLWLGTIYFDYRNVWFHFMGFYGFSIWLSHYFSSNYTSKVENVKTHLLTKYTGKYFVFIDWPWDLFVAFFC